MALPLPKWVDTCIIGNGPSALILSYILHGHIPRYVGRHQDDLLHSKLQGRHDLLDLSPDLYEHFQSSLRYSTQALPINTLLDTLLRPNADTEINPVSLVEWRYEPDRAVSHVVLGDASKTGGQWVHNPVSASWDIGTLSYAEMLSLPGYSYSDHFLQRHGRPMPEFQRPSRTEVAGYYAAYPAAVGMSQAMRTSTNVTSIRRDGYKGFHVSTGLSSIRCKHLVLASGIFSTVLRPPPQLQALSTLDDTSLPLLLVGSGFSAADIIISTDPHRKIVHLFNWDPQNRPSPLKGCHHQAYPEYAGIYRQMKLAAMASQTTTVPARHRKSVSAAVSASTTRKRSSFSKQRDWQSVYEGLPNATLLGTSVRSNGVRVVQIRTADGAVLEREVGGFAYVVGRRGSMAYLEDSLRREIMGESNDVRNGLTGINLSEAIISGKTFRARAEIDLEIAPSVFIMGSLTGDSLVRHAFGGCVYVAGRLMGHGKSSPASPTITGKETDIRSNGIAHEDLHLDRRKLNDT